MEILENLGCRIKEKRGVQGIRAAAKEIGISHATLSRVERGFLPDLENYQKICRWLGVENKTANIVQARHSKSSVVQVHFRKKKTTSPDTAHALAELILAAQSALMDGQEET
jgi:transcriptional regulator with XRE-family HTH domain